ncbi:DEAD-box ATP-dependent DNA helicase Fancm isoform X2 [Battus philenor]|uniref:DEAD-box ATP-dependent DNA helicase Fancm isoform X2 n=1 Tax=Battus philenor TaxID=42288 RepID=UPI0035D10B13
MDHNRGMDPDEEFVDEMFDNTSLLEQFEHAALQAGLSSWTEGNHSKTIQNTSINDSALNVSALCCDEEISGYDKLTGKTWIYPTNYPIRDYQFNIIKASILKNTLVSLPTGLGKTFIAAVIMYNFYRWYPLGKIVFTAPTRPLVAQQIEACYNIIAIPPKDTIEMTGHMHVNTRKTHWEMKRVFFATPQVIYNDIKSGICPREKIRCLVIDEAHRARGNYAYCQIVSTLTEMGHKTYRLLALSATPGSKVEDVITVVKNLHIAHLELRTESCIDVAPYSHSRKISTVVVQLGPELTQLRQQYVEILDGYARRLKQLNILPQNLGNLSKGRIVMLYKEYQCKERGARHPQHNYIMKDFTLLISLYHGLELLVKHGSRVFLNFFDEHTEKSWTQSDDRLMSLLERLRDDLGINPLSLDRSILPDGTVPEMPKNLSFGHPKFYKLKEIMLGHFQKAKEAGQDTRAIVFCEYRESVNLVHCLLLQCRPLITPQMFVGQGASGKDGKTMVSQKQQLRVMRSFRAGESNTLVATCVAEEGLDVGNVDLILCFDISTRSPIRLVQRCGRTGRERGGQVYILVTEGREHQTLLDCMRQRDGLNKKILQSKEVENNLYKENPRMVPRDFVPACQKMYITVAQKSDTKSKSNGGGEKNKKGQKDLRSMLIGKDLCKNPINKESRHSLTRDEFNDIFPMGFIDKESIPNPIEFCFLNKAFPKVLKLKQRDKLASWLEWQRTVQKTVNIGHSKDTEILTELLQYSDAKRCELPPTTQNPAFSSVDIITQKSQSPMKSKIATKNQKKIFKSPSKKDGDIRALFSAATKSTKSYTKLLNDLGVHEGGNLPTRLINLLVDLSLDNANIANECYICLKVCSCSVIQKIRDLNTKPTKIPKLQNKLNLPDVSLLDDISSETISACGKSDSGTNNYGKNISSRQENIINKVNEFDLLKLDVQKNANITTTNVLEENFDIGDIDDIFAESSPELSHVKEVDNQECVEKNSSKPKEALEFFGLDSIEDIFADSDENNEDKSQEDQNVEDIDNRNNDSPILQPLSPSILSSVQKVQTPISPILCSQVRKYRLGTNKIHTKSNSIIDVSTATANDDVITPSYLTNAVNKSMFTVTQLVEMINRSDAEVSASKRNISKNESACNLNERSLSPILFTQANRRKTTVESDKDVNKTVASDLNRHNSLIILDSDSDSDNTLEYSVGEGIYTDINDNVGEKSKEIPEISNKRKLSTEDAEGLISSPFFYKKQKLNNSLDKPLSLQERVLAALTSNEINNVKPNNSQNLYFAFSLSSPICPSQKENANGKLPKAIPNCNGDEKGKTDGSISMLQKFRRDKTKVEKLVMDDEGNVKLQTKRRITFCDSDDDFENDVNGYCNKSLQIINSSHRKSKCKNRRNKRKNEFIDEEAELSEDGSNLSADELTDESIGSIVDFICDDNETHSEADMHAHYLRSVRSPVKGVFKIPHLPKVYENTDVFSQFVEDDAYEMDSFCVDSHVGLTQVNEESELDLAEKYFENRKRKKKKKVQIENTTEKGDSPVIRRNNKNLKRQIHSDSSDDCS